MDSYLQKSGFFVNSLLELARSKLIHVPCSPYKPTVKKAGLGGRGPYSKVTGQTDYDFDCRVSFVMILYLFPRNLTHRKPAHH